MSRPPRQPATGLPRSQPARLRSWLAGLLVLFVSTVVGIFQPSSMVWSESQTLCADVAVTVAVKTDRSMATDLLDYRVTAGRSHGPPAAFDAQRNAHQTYYVLAGSTPVLVHNCNKNQGVYEFPDQLNPGQTYVGKTNDFNRRLQEHVDDGRLASVDDATCTHVCGTDDDLFVAEHLRMEQLRRQGVPLSNERASPGRSILESRNQPMLPGAEDW